MYAEINPSLNYNKSLPNTQNCDKYAETPSFSKFQEMNRTNKSFGDNYCGGGSSYALRGMQMESTPVSLTFFSDANVKRIQKQLKKEIFRLSNGTFRLDTDQDADDLMIVMRAVFFDNGQNLPTHVVRQVKKLNRETIKYIIPDMLTNIKQQYDYIKEITQPRQIMPQPLNVNRTNRTLPSFTTLWQ